jgi:hypothetical protein
MGRQRSRRQIWRRASGSRWTEPPGAVHVASDSGLLRRLAFPANRPGAGRPHRLGAFSPLASCPARRATACAIRDLGKPQRQRRTYGVAGEQTPGSCPAATSGLAHNWSLALNRTPWPAAPRVRAVGGDPVPRALVGAVDRCARAAFHLPRAGRPSPTPPSSSRRDGHRRRGASRRAVSRAGARRRAGPFVRPSTAARWRPVLLRERALRPRARLPTTGARHPSAIGASRRPTACTAVPSDELGEAAADSAGPSCCGVLEQSASFPPPRVANVEHAVDCARPFAATNPAFCASR